MSSGTFLEDSQLSVTFIWDHNGFLRQSVILVLVWNDYMHSYQHAHDNVNAI